MHIILINGKKRSGKDFTAKLIQEQLPNATILHFADPLKEIIASTFDISLEELEIYKNNPDDIIVNVLDNGTSILDTNFRKLLQRFGTEAMKPIFGDDIWADLLISKLNTLPSNTEYVIIPDWRFKTEYDVIRNHYKVTTIHVEAGIDTGDTHSSENVLCHHPFHYRLDNTVQDGRLQVQVRSLHC